MLSGAPRKRGGGSRTFAAPEGREFPQAEFTSAEEQKERAPIQQPGRLLNGNETPKSPRTSTRCGATAISGAAEDRRRRGRCPGSPRKRGGGSRTFAAPEGREFPQAEFTSAEEQKERAPIRQPGRLLNGNAAPKSPRTSTRCGAAAISGAAENRARHPRRTVEAGNQDRGGALRPRYSPKVFRRCG